MTHTELSHPVGRVSDTPAYSIAVQFCWASIPTSQGSSPACHSRLVSPVSPALVTLPGLLCDVNFDRFSMLMANQEDT